MFSNGLTVVRRAEVAQDAVADASPDTRVRELARSMAGLSSYMLSTARCLAEGLGAKEMAKRLNLGLPAVAQRRKRLYEKLGLSQATCGDRERRKLISEAYRQYERQFPSAARENASQIRLQRVAVPSTHTAEQSQTAPAPEAAAPQGLCVPVTLVDPATVLNIRVVSGTSEESLAAHIAAGRRDGFQPEVFLVWQPDTVPLRQIVLVRRMP